MSAFRKEVPVLTFWPRLITFDFLIDSAAFLSFSPFSASIGRVNGLRLIPSYETAPYPMRNGWLEGNKRKKE